MTRWILILTFALLCAGSGAGYYLQAQKLPLYKDEEAVSKLSMEVSREGGSRGQRMQRWMEGIKKLQTQHWPLSNLGRGLMALACGLVLAGGLWQWMQGLPVGRRPEFLAWAWTGLWLLSFFGAVFHHQRLQAYLNFPGSSDSLTVPIVAEGIRLVIGYVGTGLLLKFLCQGWQLPARWQWSRPSTLGEWIRAVVLGLGMVYLIWRVWDGILYGRAGQVVACAGAVSLLVLVLASRREKGVAKRPVREVLADSETRTFRYKL